MSYVIIDCDGDKVTSSKLSIQACLKYLAEECSFEYAPYAIYSNLDLQLADRNEVRNLLSKLGNNTMIDHQNVQGFINSSLGIEPPAIKKFLVLTKSHRICGSWDLEEDVIKYIKNEIKQDSKERFFILEALKEVGRKSPEIEIEDL